MIEILKHYGNDLLFVEKTIKDPLTAEGQHYNLEFSLQRELSIKLDCKGLNGVDMVWFIKPGFKNQLKMSLHLLERMKLVGLLRVDFNGSPHQNPEEANEYVIDALKPYAGNKLTTSHIHFNVPGYGQLKWAIPVESSDFPEKRLDDHQDMKRIIASFATFINVKTPISVSLQTSLML